MERGGIAKIIHDIPSGLPSPADNDNEGTKFTGGKDAAKEDTTMSQQLPELEQAEAHAYLHGWTWLHRDPVLSYDAIRVGYGVDGYSYTYAGKHTSGAISREHAAEIIAAWRAPSGRLLGTATEASS